MQTSRQILSTIFKTTKIYTRNLPQHHGSNFPPDSFSNRTIKCSEKPSALVLLAPGAEELEAITTVDVLRRGCVKVIIGGVEGAEGVQCQSKTVICPNMTLEEAAHKGPYDVVILPGGGEGARTLCHSGDVGRILKAQEESGGLIAAICAAPTALKKHRIFKGKHLTSYPAMAEEMKKGCYYKYEEKKPVVVDGNLITSRGPATAFLFAFTILEKLYGKERAQKVAKEMLYKL